MWNLILGVSKNRVKRVKDKNNSVVTHQVRKILKDADQKLILMVRS